MHSRASLFADVADLHYGISHRECKSLVQLNSSLLRLFCELGAAKWCIE